MTELSPVQKTWLHLLSCALCGAKPDMQRLRQVPLSALYALARSHSMTAMTAFALEAAGVNEPHFHEAKIKAIRKVALFDIERGAVCRALNDAEIAHCPLKGVILMKCYPAFGMREMSDNDILCDPSRMEDVRAIMESQGFTCTEFGKWVHDNYEKPPTLEFEMHRCLFDEKSAPLFAAYYADIFDRLIRTDGFAYRFSVEDFYLYLLAHAFTHFTERGIGLRPLMDVYVFLKAHPGLDRQYLGAELEKLQLTEFEKHTRNLSDKVFSGGALTCEETGQLLLFLDSPLYGTEEQREQNTLTRKLGGKDSKSAKAKYFRDRIFLSGEALKQSYPFFYRHRALLPALYIYRPIKGVITHPKRLLHDTKKVIKYQSPKYRF